MTVRHGSGPSNGVSTSWCPNRLSRILRAARTSNKVIVTTAAVSITSALLGTAVLSKLTTTAPGRTVRASK